MHEPDSEPNREQTQFTANRFEPEPNRGHPVSFQNVADLDKQEYKCRRHLKCLPSQIAPFFCAAFEDVAALVLREAEK